MIAAAAAAALVPLYFGRMGWSWDGINHHVYLGLIAEHPRWDRDVVAASFQSYQYPYLYWPIYRLSQWGVSGAGAGAAWAAFQAAMLMPPLWLLSYRLLPATAGYGPALAERVAACALGMTSIVVWMGLDTTANDLMAAVPLVWCLAVALGAEASGRRWWLVGGLYGVSVAFKLSNGIYLPLLLVFWWQPAWPYLPWRRGLALGLGSLLGFLLAYGPWGLQLWRATGSPLYPYLRG